MDEKQIAEQLSINGMLHYMGLNLYERFPNLHDLLNTYYDFIRFVPKASDIEKIFYFISNEAKTRIKIMKKLMSIIQKVQALKGKNLGKVAQFFHLSKEDFLAKFPILTIEEI